MAPFSMRAVESITVIALPENDGCAQIGLRYDLTRHLRFAVKPPHVAFSRLLGHVVLDSVSGYHGLAKFGFVDRQKEHRLGVQAHTQHAENTRRLSHSLNQQHAWKYRVVREMPHELRFVRRNVLDPDAGFVAVDGDDPINHQERVAMWQCLEDAGDVGRLDRLTTDTHLAS